MEIDIEVVAAVLLCVCRLLIRNGIGRAVWSKARHPALDWAVIGVEADQLKNILALGVKYKLGVSSKSNSMRLDLFCPEPLRPGFPPRGLLSFSHVHAPLQTLRDVHKVRLNPADCTLPLTQAHTNPLPFLVLCVGRCY